MELTLSDNIAIEIYQVKYEDLKEYLQQKTLNSFNEYIKNRDFSKKKNIIVLADLSGEKINNLDLTGADLQGVILGKTKFDNCNFTDVKLCDTDLTDVTFADCKFIGTDLRGANLHYTDFHYSDLDEDSQIKDLGDKFKDIKINISDLKRLNKYIDEDVQKEQDYFEEYQQCIQSINRKQEKLELLKADIKSKADTKSKKEIKQIQKTIGTLSKEIQNLKDEFTNAPNRRKGQINVEIEQASETLNTFEKIQKLSNDIKNLESKLSSLSNMRMFCGKNLDGIFEQLQKQKIPIQVDPSYIRGLDAADRDAIKTYVKLNEDDINAYLEKAKTSKTPLSLVEFARNKDKLGANINVIPDLSEINLAKKEFKNLDLRNAIFAGANLANIKIIECDIRGASFEGANLQNSQFDKVNGSDTNFLFTNLKNAKITNSNLERSYMPKIDLSQSKIENCNLNAAILINANAESSEIANSELNNTNFTGTSLAYANMQKNKMQKTILNAALLDNAKLISCDLQDAFMNQVHALNAEFIKSNMKEIKAIEGNFNDAEFKEVSLEGADLRKAMLERVQAIKVNMKKALLDKANFEFANLESATLENASAKFTNFNEAILEKVNAKNIDMSDAIASSIKASHADFTNAIIERANLSKAELRNAILHFVDAKYANMEKAILNNTEFNGAKFSETNTYNIVGIPKGKIQYENDNGHYETDINDHIQIQNKIKRRSEMGWFTKTVVGQIFARVSAKTIFGTINIVPKISALCKEKPLAIVGATAVGLIALAISVSIAWPFGAVAIGISVVTAPTIGGFIGAKIGIETSKILAPTIEKLNTLNNTINSYISPPPENIDKLVEIQQKTEQKLKKLADEAKDTSEKNVNHKIGVAKKDMKQAQYINCYLASNQINNAKQQHIHHHEEFKEYAKRPPHGVTEIT